MKTFIISFIVILSSIVPALAAIPVGIIPFEGEGQNPKNFEDLVRQIFTQHGVISIIADDSMQKVIEIHEKAQSTGSSYHDISKLNVAEYLIKGSVKDSRAQLAVIDVNAGSEIFSETFDYSKDKMYQIKKTVSSVKDLIVVKSSQRGGVPSDAKPYMEIVNNFVTSLEMGEISSYPYLGFYKEGAYRHPSADDKDLSMKGKDFVKILKPVLIRAKLIYNGIDTKSSSIIYLKIIAEKTGKRTKHKFGIMEMEDGSLGITNHELE
jgi:hypothetical protein